MNVFKLSGNTKLQILFVAWLTTFFIFICLLFHVGVVEAEGNTTSLSEQFGNGSTLDYLFNYDESPLTLIGNSDSYNSGYYTFDSSSSDNYTSVLTSIANYPLLNTFTISGTTYNLSDFSNFCAFKHNDDIYICLSNYDFYYYYKVYNTGVSTIGHIYCGGGYVYINTRTNSYDYYDTFSDVSFYMYRDSNNDVVENPRRLVDIYNNSSVLISNCPIYSVGWEHNGSSEVNGGYLVSSWEYDIAYNKFGVSSGSSTENDLNNLFLNNAHWTFSIPKGNDSRGFPKSFLDNGKAVFSGLLNKYQSDHLDNFYFHYTFYIQPQYQQGTGSGDSGGGGHPISILDAFRQNEITNNTTFFPPVFQFNLNGQTYYNQTMREFNSAGQSCTFFTTEYLFDNCFYQGDSFNDYIENWHFSNMTNCYLYCTAVMFSTGGGVSGTCQAWYDLCTGQSGVTSENMTINPDPYNPDSITPPSTTTTSGQFGNIIINNNNTLNGGSGLPIGSTATQQEQASFFKLFNPVKFFLGLLTGSNSSTGEELRQSLGVNNWLTIMTTTFSFIPPSFINGLGVFFKVTLGILIIGLIFRVILDLL